MGSRWQNTFLEIRSSFSSEEELQTPNNSLQEKHLEWEKTPIHRSATLQENLSWYKCIMPRSEYLRSVLMPYLRQEEFYGDEPIQNYIISTDFDSSKTTLENGTYLLRLDFTVHLIELVRLRIKGVPESWFEKMDDHIKWKEAPIHPAATMQEMETWHEHTSSEKSLRLLLMHYFRQEVSFNDEPMRTFIASDEHTRTPSLQRSTFFLRPDFALYLLDIAMANTEKQSHFTQLKKLADSIRWKAAPIHLPMATPEENDQWCRLRYTMSPTLFSELMVYLRRNASFNQEPPRNYIVSMPNYFGRFIEEFESSEYLLRPDFMMHLIHKVEEKGASERFGSHTLAALREIASQQQNEINLRK